MIDYEIPADSQHYGNRECLMHTETHKQQHTFAFNKNSEENVQNNTTTFNRRQRNYNSVLTKLL